MKPINSSTPDLAQLPKIFQNYPDILAVYLFGSAAIGRRHLESDLDLAIVPRDASLRNKRLEILTDLTRHGFDRIDLVFLDTDDVVLKFEAVRHNNIIYQAEGFDSGSYFSKVIRQYFDYKPYLKVQRQAYKRRVLSGQT